LKVLVEVRSKEKQMFLKETFEVNRKKGNGQLAKFKI